MPQLLRSLLLAAALLVGGSLAASASEPSKADEALAAKLVTALAQSDHAAFVVDGETPFQRITKEQFAAVAGLLAPRLKAGYAISHLGDLRQMGYRVTLWKISFADGGDDALATLSLKDGKVGGFFIK